MTNDMNITELVNDLTEDDQKPVNLTVERETQGNSLGLQVNKKTGVPFKNNKNLATILREDKAISKVMAYNAFTYDIELIREAKVSGVKFDKGFVDETFTKAIMLYISETYGVDFSKNQIQDILEIVAKANAFNPVKDYLLICEKNYKGTDPLNILSDYLGVIQSNSVRLMTEIFFKGAVSKVLYPHLPFDYTLDLVGDQGTGKSRLLNAYLIHFIQIILILSKIKTIYLKWLKIGVLKMQKW